MYSLIRPILFTLDAERSHDLIIDILSLISRHKPALRLCRRVGARNLPHLPCKLAHLELPNPLGLAAGLDKDARAFPALAACGFGWLELGTVTPKPQSGNQLPRLFRVERDLALVNRMGFNSVGLAGFMQNLRSIRKNTDAVLGINIGKNAATALESAAGDYLVCLDAVYEAADYVTINVSSPNTESLRKLQNRENLENLLDQLIQRRKELQQRHKKTVPMLLKISPDLEIGEIDAMVNIVQRSRIDGVIATNTTVSRPSNSDYGYSEAGGLSGPPLRRLSTEVVRRLNEKLADEIPVIGVGGISTAQDSVEKITAGADLLQLYTSFIYQGPTVIREVLRGLQQEMRSMQTSSWSDYTKSIRA